MVGYCDLVVVDWIGDCDCCVVYVVDFYVF